MDEQEADVACAVPASMASKAIWFKAHIMGSYDGSNVAIQVTELNGAPVACDTGSNIPSAFEDGEVTLDL